MGGSTWRVAVQRDPACVAKGVVGLGTWRIGARVARAECGICTWVSGEAGDVDGERREQEEDGS